MKTTGIIAALLLLICPFTHLSAQELIKPVKLTVKWTLTDLGDAQIEASNSMDAAGWDRFKRMFGNNPDILKRQMERTLSGYFLQNFNYKEDAMNRTWTLSFDALGLSKISSNGSWVVDLNSKNPDITKLSDHNYVLTSNYASEGSLLQEVDYINFPASASDIKQDKNALGKAVCTYTLSPRRGGLPWGVLVLGAILSIVGVFLLLRSGSSGTVNQTAA